MALSAKKVLIAYHSVMHFLSIRFEYLKACGTTLIVPNVAPGFQWNGERIRLLSHHSCLYIRSLYPLLNKVVWRSIKRLRSVSISMIVEQ